MKKLIAGVAPMLACLLLGAAARADCTSNPFRMGWDAAQQACDDIANGWLPTGAEKIVLQPEPGADVPTPEKSCTSTDVIQCKNAMNQYLRDSRGKSCAHLVQTRAPLTNSLDGSTAGNAMDTWRDYVLTTCNR